MEEAEAEQERALADLEKNAKSVAAKKARERQALEQQLGGADASESDLQQRIAEANGRYKQAAAEKERLNPLVQEAKAEQRDEEERLKRLKQAKEGQGARGVPPGHAAPRPARRPGAAPRAVQGAGGGPDRETH